MRRIIPRIMRRIMIKNIELLTITALIIPVAMIIRLIMMAVMIMDNDKDNDDGEKLVILK